MNVSYIIPSLIGLDKALETLETNYTHFNRALRTGLCTHFKDLIQQNEMIVATVLDPRIKLQVLKYLTSVIFRSYVIQKKYSVLCLVKPVSCLEVTRYSPHPSFLACVFLQPFSDAKLEEQTEFLMPPSKCKVRTIVEARLGSSVASAVPKEADQDEAAKEVKVEQDVQKKKHTDELSPEASGDSSDEMAEGDDLKRKSIFNFLQPPAKAVKMSELDVYLSEPLVESNSSLSYWKSATRFPQLQRLSRKLFAVPSTSGGFDWLYPMAACIVRARRNHLPPHTTERLLLYKNSFKTKVVKKSIGVSKP